MERLQVCRWQVASLPATCDLHTCHFTSLHEAWLNASMQVTHSTFFLGCVPNYGRVAPGAPEVNLRARNDAP